MAKAAKVTIAEVEEIVELGCIPPDQVHLPGIFVDRIILGEKFEKRIEVGLQPHLTPSIKQQHFFQRVTVQKVSDSTDSVVKRNPAAETRERIIRRAALEFKDGMYGK